MMRRKDARRPALHPPDKAMTREELAELGRKVSLLAPNGVERGLSATLTNLAPWLADSPATAVQELVAACKLLRKWRKQ